jgi:hypothetical protein
MGFATLLAALALAGADEPVCHGQLAPPTKAEQEQAALEEYASTRAEFGFRSDIPYIQELIRRDMWEYDVGYIPATPAENRYLRLRDRLELGAKAWRYLRRRPNLSGGISVQDDWPREPYLLLRLTSNPKLHERRLERLARFPDNLRTRKVAHSERELRRIQNRISFRAHRRDGFQVVSTGVDIDRNRVEIELITKRTDHARYFKRRYGPLVITRVIAAEPAFLDCAEAGTYEVAPDGRGLVVHWTRSGSVRLDHVELVERADRVEVGVVERVPHGAITGDAVGDQAPVSLAAPLGDRMVIDAATGRRLVQTGPSPGEPPCPPAQRYSRLEEFIRTRQEFGLRHDREFVRRMLRRKDPYTQREHRYLRVRDVLETLTYDRPVERYLDRHRDEFGGTAIIDRFPARPLMQLRFTRRPAVHLARLRRVARRPELLRAVLTPYSARELEAVAERISEDAEAGDGFLDGFGDAGFLIAGAFPDGETGVVVVRVITPRADHAEYFRSRYGPAVRTELAGTRFECREGDLFTPRE